MVIKRRTVILSAATCMVSTIGGPAQASEYQVNALQNCVLVDKNDKSFSLSSFNKSLLLIDLWGSWCSACIIGMPGLNSIAIRNPDKLDVLLISHPDAWEKDKIWQERHRGPCRAATIAPQSHDMLPIVFAYAPMTRSYAVPKAFLLDSQRRTVLSHEGSLDWESSDIARKIQKN